MALSAHVGGVLSMLKITGGRLRGRHIDSPSSDAAKNKHTRPTTALIRESVFSRLHHQLSGARFLDLFAGSGIMGIEAISRGATFVLGVELDIRQARRIRDNYTRLGVDHTLAKVVHLKAEALVSQPCREGAFDIIFMDPPYGYTGWEGLLTDCLKHGWVAPDGVLIAEQGIRDADLPSVQSGGAVLEWKRTDYGDTSLLIGSLSQAESD